MDKITNYIFNLSPRSLAIYLLIAPLVLFLLYNVILVVFKQLEVSGYQSLVFGIALLCLTLLVILYLSWLYSIVFSLGENNLGLTKRWFSIALLVLVGYLAFHLCALFKEHFPEGVSNLFSMANEFISFAGLVIAYPIACHYAARAVYYKKHGEKPSFSKTLPITALLIFSVVLCVPYFHKNFSTKVSTNKQIATIYIIAFIVYAFIFVISLIAAIAGLI